MLLNEKWSDIGVWGRDLFIDMRDFGLLTSLLKNLSNVSKVGFINSSFVTGLLLQFK
jgi:hypothetical protein